MIQFSLQKNKLQQIKKQKKGFTLVETLIAISILAVAIASAISVASKSTFAAYYSRDQITAFYLAAEGIELTRNIRDNAYLQNKNNWLDDASGSNTGLDDPTRCNNTNGCYIDPVTLVVTECSAVNCNGTPIKLDHATGIYSYASSGQVSKFTRTIIVKPIVINQEDEVDVNITWTGFGTQSRSFTISENIFKWH